MHFSLCEKLAGWLVPDNGVKGVKSRRWMVTSGYASGLRTGAISILMTDGGIEFTLGEFADDTK